MIKKIAFIVAAVFCGSLVQNQACAGVVVTAARAAAEEQLAENLKNMEAFAAALESAKDKATADAAAAEITRVVANLNAIAAKGDLQSKLNRRDQQALAQMTVDGLQQITPRIKAEAARLQEQNFYGSEALQTVLQSLTAPAN